MCLVSYFPIESVNLDFNRFKHLQFTKFNTFAQIILTGLLNMSAVLCPSTVPSTDSPYIKAVTALHIRTAIAETCLLI